MSRKKLQAEKKKRYTVTQKGKQKLHGNFMYIENFCAWNAQTTSSLQ